jgi:hypothetical protein
MLYNQRERKPTEGIWWKTSKYRNAKKGNRQSLFTVKEDDYGTDFLAIFIRNQIRKNQN